METLTKRDMLSYIYAVVEQHGLVDHNLEGFNQLVSDSGINKIMSHVFTIDRTINNDRENDPIKKFELHINFHNVIIGNPVYTLYIQGKSVELTPFVARLTGRPYSGPITLQATVIITAFYLDGSIEKKKIDIPRFDIGLFPIMVGSVKCNTSNWPREALKNFHEDPMDHGGYFIIKSGEYLVDLLENIRYNSMHIHAKMHYQELVRNEFLSQPGGAFENSYQLIIRYLKNGQITVEISSATSEKESLPFFIIYRLLGMVSDKDIANTIVFDVNDKSIVTEKLLEILDNAFHLANDEFQYLLYEVRPDVIIYSVADHISKFLSAQKHEATESAIQFINTNVLKNLDSNLLPHMGQTPGSRIKKLKFIGLMIYKMLLVHLKILDPIDRDSYPNKRVHGPGVSLSKAFKTQININRTSHIVKALINKIKTTPWKDITSSNIIDIIISSTYTKDLSKAMEQSITSANQIVNSKKKITPNKVSSQPRERKNILHLTSSARTIVAQNAGNSSKQTERADLMRRVHPTYIGYICVAQSADSGEKVGMRKQLAITATVCLAEEALPFKEKLMQDPAIIPLDKVSGMTSEIILARVFVNGEWIGYCTESYNLATRWRGYRRQCKIVEPRTTIYWDPIINEIHFWLDVGRLTKPIIIVYNNIEEYEANRRAIFKQKREKDQKSSHSEQKEQKDSEQIKPIKFQQYTKFTKEHVRKIKLKQMTLNDLIEGGIAEYITPEEHENCFIAESIDELIKNQNDVTNQYTHFDVEQAIFGLAGLVPPYGNHTQPTRVTHATNHARQACSWYSLNFPYLPQKNKFFQFAIETPIIKTIVNDLLPPNSMNTIIAYASYGGDNQEDSAIMCQSSIDRGLYNGALLRYEKVELEKDQLFTNPDISITKNIKPNASYEKLEKGFIKKGSTVRYGDVLVGRVTKIIKRDDSVFQYIDNSVVYRLTEPALVEDVITPRGVSDELFVLVKLRYERPLRIGDKLASRCGNKSIVAKIMRQSDMPFTESGLTPDIIINTNHHPSRMTNGQLMETSQGLIAAELGTIIDGTSFTPVNHYEIGNTLVSLGFRYNGQERMYNGMTGEHLDYSIFIGPTAEQRIQKFVLDDEQVVAGSGPTDIVTGQPLGGKHIQGGLRFGEMEVWALSSHGSIATLAEKMCKDSDGTIDYICARCHNVAIYNEFENISICNNCGEYADIVAIHTSKAARLFREQLATSNIGINYNIKPRTYMKAKE